MSLMQQLRDAVQLPHQRIETLPVTRAMVEGTITRAAYLNVLGQLWHLHDALEGALGRREELACVYRPGQARAGVAARDLEVLGGDTPAPGEATRALVSRIRHWEARTPWALLGPLYVLEGSRMGSLMLARPLARALGVPPLPGHGLDYHTQDMAGRPRHWQEFKAAMEAAPLTADRQRDVIDAALETFSGLYDLYEAVSAERAAPAWEDAPLLTTGKV